MKKYKVLLLASYCDENCSDEFPCDECLKMCNVCEVPQDTLVAIGGFDYLKGIQNETRH
jgi:hypothetical protein